MVLTMGSTSGFELCWGCPLESPVAVLALIALRQTTLSHTLAKGVNRIRKALLIRPQCPESYDDIDSRSSNDSVKELAWSIRKNKSAPMVLHVGGAPLARIAGSFGSRATRSAAVPGGRT
jgi:hypothetical protein